MKDPATAGERDALRQIYQSTRGYCDGCRRKLAFCAYARADVRGAWDIDARLLRPVCRTCLERHVPRVSRPGHTPARAPAAAARSSSGSGCRHTVLGGLLGAFVLGPWGALLGGLLGAEVDGGER